jgi:Ni/Co efflux regulator RcnB
MNVIRKALALTTVSLTLSSGVALAQNNQDNRPQDHQQGNNQPRNDGRPGDNNNRQGNYQQQGNRPQQGNNQQGNYQQQGNRQQQGNYQQQGNNFRPGDNRGPGGGGYVRHDDWRRGGRIQRNDWNRGQQVDYRRYRLNAPPRGYEWRQVDGNFVLAAVTTGIIASVVAASLAGR